MLRPGLVATALLAGCIPLPVEGEQDDLRTLEASRTSDAEGLASFTFTVGDESSMLLTFEAESPYLGYVHALYAPDGTKVFDAEQLWEEVRWVSSAAFPDGVVSLNWPITPSTALQPGEWTVEVGVLDAEYFYVQSAAVDFRGQLKRDDSFSGGSLDVDVVYVGDTIGDPDLEAAIDEAVAYWQELYAAIGIDLAVAYWEYDGVTSLPAPGLGAEADYVAIADTTPMRALNVVIVPQIQDGQGLYGMAGGIPGPLVSTGNSAVTISANTNAGPDLVFSPAEIGLLGETLAHEVGHFAGLFHPVESDYSSWDSLGDTPECSAESDCIDKLGTNLMYPYPVCYGDGSCIAQDWLSDEQGEVTNRYTGVW